MTLLLNVALLAFSALDLAAVKAEPNPERRANLAIDNANQAIDRAKQHYAKGKFAEAQAAVAEVRESIELCHESLRTAGRDPAKDRKQFKKVELRTNSLIRRLKDYRVETSVEDHPVIDKVITELESINDELLEGLFSRKKK